ncbi:host cell division inhibitor Icd-like protein [Enterobacter hormaechei]|uniref:host cell division inhibitor Icd-like protein n=1 Tax=Enterobacter hormaechei TaxID=158836 RepID=UPI002F268C4D
MPSMISCAMRAVTDCDFAFFEPVAMSTFSKIECKTLYTKNYYLEALTCKTLAGYCVSYTLFELRCVNSEARQCANTNRASDHNVIGANNMADLQHNQTRPEFTWRFLSASERYPTAKPLVIYVNASSEQEARDTMPGVNLIFAARLPFHAFQLMEVSHA